MRVVVTGGAGFIGSHTVNYLVDAGDEVLVVDDFSVGHVRPPAPARLLKADIFSEQVAEVLSRFKPQAVIHLAARVDVEASWECPQEDLRINVEGTLRLLELCRSLGQVRFVFASSAAVYGANPGVVREHEAPEPCSPYGLGKMTAERYLDLWGSRWEIPWVALRYANVYGPYPNDTNPKGVCRVFAQRIENRLPLLINGRGSQSRDFVSVYDVARANYLACHSDLFGEILNISSGRAHTILEVVENLKEASARQPEIIFAPEGAVGVAKSVLSPVRAMALLEWEPEWSLQEGLFDLWSKVYQEQRAVSGACAG